MASARSRRCRSAPPESAAADASSMISAVVFVAARVHDLVPLVEAHQTPGELGELFVLLEIGALDHQQEVRELLPRVRAEPDVPVGGRLDRRSLDRRGARKACSGSPGPPFISRFIVSEKFVNTMFAVSRIDRSMCSPRPVRRARGRRRAAPRRRRRSLPPTRRCGPRPERAPCPSGRAFRSSPIRPGA